MAAQEQFSPIARALLAIRYFYVKVTGRVRKVRSLTVVIGLGAQMRGQSEPPIVDRDNPNFDPFASYDEQDIEPEEGLIFDLDGVLRYWDPNGDTWEIREEGVRW